MFMTPIPPHHQCDGSDGADHHGQDAGGLFNGSTDLRVVAHVEIGAAVAASQQSRDGLLSRFHADRIRDAHGDAGDVALPQFARHCGGVGQPYPQQRCITGRTGVLLHHTHHAHWNIAQQQGLPDRVVGRGEEACAGIGVDHHHLLVAGHAGWTEEGALAELQAMHAEVLLADALHLHTGGAIAAQGGAAGGNTRGGAVHEWLPGQGHAVAGSECFHPRRVQVAKTGTGIDLDGVGTQRGDVGQDGLPCTGAQCYHRHDRSNADDDSEHGQEGAHAVGVHRAQCHAEGFSETVPPDLPAAATRGLGRGWRRHARCQSCTGCTIIHDPPIADFDDALRMLGHGHVMRDQHHSMALGVQLAEDLHHLFAGMRIQRTCGFVGEDHRATIHQRTRNRNALLLAARELAREMLHTLAQTQPRQQGGCPCMACFGRHAGVDRRHLHIAQCSQIGQQVVALEDEAEVLAA